MREIIVDNFAGGGGASTGIELATGRVVNIAINHGMGQVKSNGSNGGCGVVTNTLKLFKLFKIKRELAFILFHDLFGAFM